MEALNTENLQRIEDVLPYRAGEIRYALSGLILVLLDAEHYLSDPEYRKQRSAGRPALRNLWAFNSSGTKIWEAEMPEPNDYYYEIVGLTPLTLRSFSGNTCELDPVDGRILRRTFHK